MSEVIELSHPRGVTEIRIGAEVLGRVDGALERAVQERSIFVVSAAPLLGLHRERLSQLENRAKSCTVLEIEDGESSKALSVAENLWRRMLQEGGKRDSVVVAFGGGTIGDLGGFVAGAFLRGVELIQVPTTLLAQVDAAIGGKTAVNLPEAKNTVGLFHHPEVVVCDTEILGTLPPAELRSGLFEVVKMGAIRDPKILDLVEEHLPELLAANPEVLTPVVARAVAAKVEVVEKDPEEAGLRRLLNFGHTVGHALEAELGYSELRHGEAVGYGMLFALKLAVRRGLEASSADRVRRLIRKIGLPRLTPIPTDRLLGRIARDKKARESGLAWVYPTEIGVGRVDSQVPIAEVEGLLDELVGSWADS